MNQLKLLAAMLVLASVSAASAQAQTVGRQPSSADIQAMFARLDTNGDGVLQKTEWLVSLSPRLKERADTLWLRIEPTGGSWVSKQRFLQVSTPG